MTLLALCALLLTGAEAFSAPVAPRGLSRTASPAMKHNEYYGRLAKAEAGRMRLVCVRRPSARACSTPRTVSGVFHGSGATACHGLPWCTAGTSSCFRPRGSATMCL